MNKVCDCRWEGGMIGGYRKSAFTLCLCALLLAALVCCVKEPARIQQRPPAAKLGTNYEKEVMGLAEKLNKKISPDKVEKLGPWEYKISNVIGGPGNNLTFIMKLENVILPQMTAAEIKAQTQYKDLKSICTNNLFVDLFKHDIVLTITFIGKDGNLIGDLNITRCDCGI